MDSTPYSPGALAGQLEALGLGDGDTVLVRAALRALGPVAGGPARALIEALLAVVGPTGTVVALSHSAASRAGARPAAVFTPGSPCITGGFAAALLAWPGAFRSRHPTNSLVAVGPAAGALLGDHDETSTCFAPMSHLVAARGKLALVGCVDSSPGFSTVHLAYETLGLATRSTDSGVFGAFYEKDGARRWFRKRDVPGCSLGFSRFYPRYRAQGLLRSGRVGDAESLLVPAAEAYAVELEAVRRDPTCGLCERPDCYSCRGTRLFDPRGLVRYYARRPHRLLRLAQALLIRATVRE